jgi:aspartate racemase
MKKTIGILGGMGPYATLAFFNSILTLTDAKKDWDHVHLVIDNNTQIPSRTRYYLYNEASPLSGMVHACQKLASYPVDAIVIPCNSAQAWRDEIQKEVHVPILDIFDATLSRVAKDYSSHDAVCVLGGRVTWGMRTYEDYALRYGYGYYSLSEQLQKRIEGIIEKIKLNEQLDSAADELCGIMKSILQQKQNVVFILGCTEFGCIYNEVKKHFSLVDSSTAYAEYTVRYAKGNLI